MLLISLIIMILLMIMLMFSNHPLTVGLILLFHTILTAMITGLMSKFWFSYILFMIMVGGMLIMFLYMTSVASNKKFKFSWKFMLTTPMIFMTMTYIYLMEYTPILTSNLKLEMIITKYFEFQMNSIMIMLIFYLLLTLIAVVNITKTNFGPLRQK